MQRPKWLSGWGKGKNPFEGSLIIDIPDIKVVEASFNKKLVLFAVGTLKQRETVVWDKRSAETIGEKCKADLEWSIFYDSTVLPDFMTIDRTRELMAGTVAASSGSASVYNVGTVYIASGLRPSKGDAPLLLDHELAKKIEKARNKK